MRLYEAKLYMLDSKVPYLGYKILDGQYYTDSGKNLIRDIKMNS